MTGSPNLSVLDETLQHLKYVIYWRQPEYLAAGQRLASLLFSFCRRLTVHNESLCANMATNG